MRYYENGGGTIGGVPFKNLGLKLTKANIPLLPEIKSTEEEIPGLEGVIDLETKYGARLIELTFILVETDEVLYQVALQNIAKVMNIKIGLQPLVLDRAGGKRWMVKVNGNIPIEKLAQMGEFTVPFKAPFPFAESVTDTMEEIDLNDGYMLGMNYRLDMSPESYIFDVIDSNTFDVFHAGNHEVDPVIKISGTGSEITLTNDTTAQGLHWSGTLNGTLEIDCKKKRIKFNDQNAFYDFSGTYPKLIEGDNSITITGTSLNCEVSFIFRHTYLY
ncbi:phage tail domain-containing protein [Chengkuizengella axinellae]|uniref:Phage tail family protein n=1 Tax=Chengkuizengella axinellae TaxID=3064388 RepID=A0ABT9IYC2_9BACL|nr:phage tail domain-containing protein [Chengkuizengella sp. 2205SS18-9]MDP5274357.1 phage tail family protein [Chengkuizengella sp. 2205SS18-9]